MTKVLVVDDDDHMVRALRISLIASGYDVASCHDAATALEAAGSRPHDLVILDLGLPDMDGVAVIDALRGWSAVPIIVLSARHHEPAKVAALDAGADDYVTKPFGMPELLARVHAALRRAGPATTTAVVTTDAFTIDLAGKHVTDPAGGDIRLTPSEWQLLEILAREPNRLVTLRQLLREMWGPAFETQSIHLRPHMSSLRRKLEPDPAEPRYLVGEPNAGYRLNTGPHRSGKAR